MQSLSLSERFLFLIIFFFAIVRFFLEAFCVQALQFACALAFFVIVLFFLELHMYLLFFFFLVL